MWNKSTTVEGRWDYSVASGGTGDMPSFEHGGHVLEDEEHLQAFDRHGKKIASYLELDDAKKAVQVYG
ncbi:hypothetical protein COW36_06685 [bacterium (Candidatus Blackallbacteria) CG17_big_fil_post_rev_8_21_14_2_50_48_46]|uniref:Uncharacterized protein n=1 Tax=bacterium (Candidatus Blackallbacteria) CG17_big_fil_post_rev_8_21_14_2_50_48_46 TaxID=2014261 RepID=A0A2M7G851_9BACT|nr:MAG: hypothetical protein COW64_12100 [bacterium (Candidatus Blackallbacteria) CG18_big_fil_WC_8_21_14_2_50_49_26]PIW17958.1 MAG: hypothetical protein COW36_06685 [bacterium (Candidatus Blackallbacteria) CG17_big_fil_post_rev_8_21_14_2_50_48_46]